MSEAKKNRDNKRNIGRHVKELRDNLLDIVTGHITQNNLTTGQIQTMKNENQTLFTLLKERSPLSAKTLVDSLTIDGTLITQDMYDDLQTEYSEFKELYPDLATW